MSPNSNEMIEWPQTPAGVQGRFAVLRHETIASDHWDFMLEHAGRLVTFRCPCPMEEIDAIAVPLERIADHRLAYLDYEGPLSANRGTVTRTLRGMYNLTDSDGEAYRVCLTANAVAVGYLLQRLHTPNHWTLRRSDGRLHSSIQ